jgi:hypothetical protein
MNNPLLACLLLLGLMVSSPLMAQKKNPASPRSKTVNTDVNQWWIGVRGGTNFSTAAAQTSYSVFSYTLSTTAGDNEKSYKSFSLPGMQFGFSVSFEFIRGLSVSLLPSYASYRYEYGNSFRWYDVEDANKQVTTSYNIETRLQYVELPLTVRYEFLRGSFKPYIHAGAYYNFLTDALKKVNTTGIDQASGSDSEINVTELSVGVEDRMKKANYGIIGGAGFTQNFGNARLGLEINYHYGLQNLDNGEMKFTDNQLVTGTYDVPDDFSLNNLSISFQVIIPLKFITSKDYVPL